MSIGDNTAGPLLAGRGLVKAHGATPALRGASVELYAGEILAVTGASVDLPLPLMLAAASRRWCTACPASSGRTRAR
jgi:ABC-type phosphonate transport system ATPase subunit